MRAQLTSAFSQHLFVCPSLPWPLLTSLAVSASLRAITFLGHPLKVTVLTLPCSSYYNSSSNEHPSFTPFFVKPLFSTGWKPPNLQDDQHFILKCLTCWTSSEVGIFPVMQLQFQMLIKIPNIELSLGVDSSQAGWCGVLSPTPGSNPAQGRSCKELLVCTLCLVTCLDLSFMAMFNVLSCQPCTLCNLLPYQHLPLCLTLDALQKWDSLLRPSLRPDRRWEGEEFCPSYGKTDGICACLNSCPCVGHCHPAPSDMPEQVNCSSLSPFPLPLCKDVVQSALLLHLLFSCGL